MPKSKKIKVFILGGLGNQLFAFFFGLSVASKLKAKLIVDSSIVPFGSNNSRTNRLTDFREVYRELNFKKSNFIFNKSFKKDYYRKIINKSRKFRVIDDTKLSKTIFKSGNSYSGYFQNWFYVDFFTKPFKTFKLELKNETARYKDLLIELRSENPICVHFRLGDYLSYPEIFRILPSEYFEFCIQKAKGENHDRKVWFFIEDAKDLNHYGYALNDLSSKIIDKFSGITDTESFKLMSESSTLITSNSTYSLWAAWFVWKNGNLAFVPYHSGISGVNDDLMDERWNRYDFENDIFYPGKFNQEKYEQLEREFLSKFS